MLMNKAKCILKDKSVQTFAVNVETKTSEIKYTSDPVWKRIL